MSFDQNSGIEDLTWYNGDHRVISIENLKNKVERTTQFDNGGENDDASMNN